MGGIALAALIAFGGVDLRNKTQMEELPANSMTQTAAVTAESMKNVPGRTPEERLRFIQSFGWQVEEEPAEIREVIVPKEFDDIYMRYNDIQKLQGCDLEKLAGRRCKRFSYRVLNYPGADAEQDREIRLNLLVYKNKIVGGDVSSLDRGTMNEAEKESSFVSGFAMK